MSLARKIARKQGAAMIKAKRKERIGKQRDDQAWASKVIAAVGALPPGEKREAAVERLQRIDELQDRFRAARTRLEAFARTAGRTLSTAELREQMTDIERAAVDEFPGVRAELEGLLGISLA